MGWSNSNMGEEPISPFWSLLINPGEPTPITFPDSMLLTVTSVSLGFIPKKKAKGIIRIFSNVETIIMSSEADIDDTGFSKSRSLIATLIPGKHEFQNLNLIFSPLNITTFEVQGNLPVNVIGHLSPIEVNEEEEEEDILEDMLHEQSHSSTSSTPKAKEVPDEEVIDVQARLRALSAKKK
ncbi:hypothetical protein GPJ56_000933 [Histomonas meleagridis]|uniref:uncharacterized protein n=1 Tax=Histomonas meleagridis TaxID=135588 RepID=UPI00355A75B4|nr:hypothetical protein GPJ56_000933 [Histomonas meleagridis]KAH0803768.1 hypothetical protein GO595_002598 [Histomonas meleagridis]